MMKNKEMNIREHNIFKNFHKEILWMMLISTTAALLRKMLTCCGKLLNEYNYNLKKKKKLADDNFK